MGQAFSVTSTSTRVAQLERDLLSEKGKCSQNDSVLADLQQEVQILKKQNEELEEVTETSKQLELENQALETRIVTLTADADATNTNRMKLEACNIRTQELKNENVVLRRKLDALNETSVSRRGVISQSPKLIALQSRVRSLESSLKAQRNHLVRVMTFSGYAFRAATYKRTWTIVNAKWEETRISGELRLLPSKISYRASFVIRKGVMIISAFPGGVRRVPQAYAIWDELLQMVGKKERRPKPADVKTPTPIVKPKPSTVLFPSFLRPSKRPLRVIEKPSTAPTTVTRPYRLDVNKSKTTIAKPYRR